MRKKSHTLLLLLFYLFLSSNSIRAQEEDGYEVVKRFSFRGAFSPFTFDFNSQDFFWSISGGVEEKKYQFGIRANIEFRPYYKKIQIYDPNSPIIYQYKEKKYFFSIDLDKRFFDFNLWNIHTQFFIGSRNGLLTGNYKGTRNDLNAKIIAAPMGGLAFIFNENVLLKLGYIYFRDGLANVPDHRVTIGFYALI